MTDPVTQEYRQAEKNREWLKNNDLASGGGGGSTAGAVRWLGPCQIGSFDGQVIQANQTQSVDGGTFTFDINEETTGPIDWDASEAELIAALEALPSIGAGKVILDQWSDINSDVYFHFRDAVADGYGSVNGTNLTGPDSPYAFTVAGSGEWAVEMFTPSAGDVIEDFMHTVDVGFSDGEGPLLLYTDNPDNVDVPNWSVPIDTQGAAGIGIDTLTTTDYTNFNGVASGGNPGDALTRPTALSVLLATSAAQAAEGTVSVYQNLPTVVLNAVPIYSMVKDVPTDGAEKGLINIWVKVSTPAPLMEP